MSIDGTWNLTVNSPMGAQKSTLSLTSGGDAGTLTGSASGAQGSQPLENGKQDGKHVSWEIRITTPMPMTLQFVGQIDGDKMTGSVRAGAFGSFPFSGTRG